MNIKNDGIYDLVAKSFTGELTGEESVNLNNWKLEDQLNPLEYNDLKEIWRHSTRLAMPSQIDLPKSLHTTRKKAGIDRKQVKWLPVFAQMAAVLIMAVLLSVLYNQFLLTKPSEKNDAIVYQMVKASYGTQSRVGLADGSVVCLNSGSTLWFPNSFKGAKTRNVELTGEGHFEVAKNNEQPFIVDIQKIQVKVLGTTFNVDAYPNNSSFAIALEEGDIQIQQKSERGVADLMALKANQVAFYNQSENSLILKTDNDLNKYTAWIDGKIVLSNDPLDTVIHKLENWYNVDIELADKRLEKYRFTGTFIDEPLEQVLSILNLTSHMQYKVIPAHKLADNSYSKRKVILKSRP